MNSIINYHGNKQIEHMPIFQPVQQPLSSQIVLHVQTFQILVVNGTFGIQMSNTLG